jgi:uncharacterized protein
MSRAEDQQRMKEIFDELARGNGAPFLDAMADDFCWMIIGTTSWSGFYRGKEAVRADLLAPLLAQFADRYTNTAQTAFHGLPMTDISRPRPPLG